MTLTDEQAKTFAAARDARKNRASLCILAIEDQVMLRKLLQQVVQDEHDFLGAGTAAEGWALYIATAPNIVFMDIGLPDGDGHTLAAEIKALDPEAYIVMLTSSDSAQDVERAKANKVDGFITKPFTREMIAQCVWAYRNM